MFISHPLLHRVREHAIHGHLQRCHWLGIGVDHTIGLEHLLKTLLWFATGQNKDILWRNGQRDVERRTQLLRRITRQIDRNRMQVCCADLAGIERHPHLGRQRRFFLQELLHPLLQSHAVFHTQARCERRHRLFFVRGTRVDCHRHLDSTCREHRREHFAKQVYKHLCERVVVGWQGFIDGRENARPPCDRDFLGHIATNRCRLPIGGCGARNGQCGMAEARHRGGSC